MAEELSLRAHEAVALPLNSPIRVRLGRTTLMRVVSPQHHLSFKDRARFNPSLRGLLIGTDFDREAKRGYKGLWENTPVVIGRLQPGRFSELSSNVSRRHASFTMHGESVIIEDLGSTDGTTVLWAPSEQRTAKAPAYYEHHDRLVPDAAAVSVASERHPGRNDDSWLVDEDRAVFGVFDGVGGQDGSAAAARIAAQSVQKYFAAYSYDAIPQALVPMQLSEVMHEANNRILATERNIATTATIAKLYRNEAGERCAAIASVGDSRAYLWRNDSLDMITLDHGLSISTESQRRQLQETLANVSRLNDLTEEEKMLFRRRNVISSALGSSTPFEIASDSITLRTGDRLLLTTDGIHDNLTSEEIAAHLRAHEDTDARSAATALVDAALKRSRDESHLRAKADDMTALIVTA